ncbi:hypothetical protein ACFORL_09095 [Legionella dresdenensis]|uniref:Transmembrane cytochrome oxidase associated protein n=1 Tax=Legionella dresdenensis TaxID=450200 RepID=A0ABV8CGU6_9GAMM
MKKINRNYIALLALALVFAAPGIAAWLFYTHPQWLTATATNKGTLINPPQHLVELAGKSKWRLILWNPGPCEESCKSQLDKLARIRLALGRRLYDINQALATGTDQQLPVDLMKQLNEMGINVLFLHQENYTSLNNSPRVFIANPDNYLVLSYSVDAKPGDIFHDIKLLLGSDGNNKSN